MADASEFAAVREQFDDLVQQREADALGIWIFLATEVLFFGVMFTGFAVYRIEYHEAFAAASRHLDLWLGTANTAILLASSLSMALADVAVRSGSRRQLLLSLAVTAALGCAFLVVKGVEYAKEAGEHLVPIKGLAFHFAGVEPEHARLFFSFYFAMTGLHALHLLVGVGIVIAFLCLAWRGRDRIRMEANVRTGALYWHYVDIVWIFVFPVLYLVR